MKIYYDKDANRDVVKGKKIAIIGYGSQGHAHANNLKESGFDVIVAEFPQGGANWVKAEAAGHTVMTTADAVKAAAVIMILLPDELQADIYREQIQPNIKPGSYVGFAHGFNIHFNQIVPVFTNVIFDTSQPHSNLVFKDMFAWLDTVLELIRSHPETLFVLRAHPDEKRAGKLSRESVSDWVAANKAGELENVIFVDSLEYISSYELIERSKFIMIYNSTIGLEAAIMGKTVLSAGRSRFTPYPIVYFPDSVSAYHRQAEEFLSAGQVQAPEHFRENARRFLYTLLYRSSLPFNDFLEPSLVPGVIHLKRFNWRALAGSAVLKNVVQGLVKRTPFLNPED
jgi:hypothetical protein